MRTLRLLLRQIGYEQRSYWRNPSSAFFTFAFPLVLLFIFATMYRGTPRSTLGGISYAEYFIPGIVAFGVISACYTNLAIGMCFRRDFGVLKRLRGTPLPPWVFMAGNIGSSLLVSVLLVVLTTAVGALVYDVRVPVHWAALTLSLAVGAFCFCSLGLAITAWIPNAQASPAVVNGAIFPLLFISGTFFPIDRTTLLGSISEFFPVGHFQHAVLAGFDPLRRGSGIEPGDLLTLFVWGAAALVVAVRSFRWEPKHQ